MVQVMNSPEHGLTTFGMMFMPNHVGDVLTWKCISELQ
jgi:hypothetical protein